MRIKVVWENNLLDADTSISGYKARSDYNGNGARNPR